jgi:hypothetical protein
VADSTHAALRAHMEKWRGTARKKGPGFNRGPLAELEEQIRWTLQRIDEVREAAANGKTMRAVRKLREGTVKNA